MINTAKQIAKKSNSSFYYAFKLLPPEKRDAMNTVYAFCRETDDIVDNVSASLDVKYEKLRKWRIEFEKAFSGHSEYSLLNKLGTTISKFNIPLDPFFELIRGMEMDLQKNRYLTFDDLSLYCYRVASTVGLMCIEIFGYKHKSTKEYAINLGIAFQLTNILRDINKDANDGRIYLPQEDLAKFDYSEKALMEKTYNSNFKELMEYETKRAQFYFDKANQIIQLDDKPSLFAARAMQRIYARTLDKIVAEDYNVFEKNISVLFFEKLGISIGAWAKYSLVYT
ncbi:MAG: squalene synthase HpnD [Ignavibacteriales bacterium CG12_big_fil_rev_8_21_14_0_65_30_8]|nr:MAG: squalene synthase HpnD [Ignavibacteriales bacterium CG12_big_fil_rev_8_21_14_0_65_30_8]